MSDDPRARFERLIEEYRRAFDESAPVFGLHGDPDYGCRMLRMALDRGSPLTVREVYGDEVADGDAVA